MKTSTPNVMSADTARSQFGRILRRVQDRNERFMVRGRGENQAVIMMSLKDYLDNVAPDPAWLKKIGDASKRRGTDKLTGRQIDAVVARARRERRVKQAR